ncbi:MAG: GNAT family N-acetyltransferase [Phycisphaerales bacterium]
MHQQLDPQRYDMLPDVVERYRRWLPLRAEDPRSVFLVAETPISGSGSSADKTAPAIVGFLIATIEANIPIYHRKEFGFIHDVWVEPTHRRTGLARQLVEEALRRFRAIGVDQVRLETAALNDGARKLFAVCGFRIGTIDMLRQLDDAENA